MWFLEEKKMKETNRHFKRGDKLICKNCGKIFFWVHDKMQNNIVVNCPHCRAFGFYKLYKDGDEKKYGKNNEVKKEE